MQTDYRRDLQNNYLIIEAEESGEQDSYCLHMAEQNQIPGLLTFHSARKDGRLYLHYDITAKQPLDHLFAGKMMGSEDILFLLTGIGEILDTLQKYLLNPAHLVFDPQYVFVDGGKKQVLMCYVPENREDMGVSLLAEFILKRLNHEDRHAVELGYGFYQETLEENFSLKKTLREILNEERKQEREQREAADRMVGLADAGEVYPEDERYERRNGSSPGSGYFESGEVKKRETGRGFFNRGEAKGRETGRRHFERGDERRRETGRGHFEKGDEKRRETGRGTFERGETKKQESGEKYFGKSEIGRGYPEKVGSRGKNQEQGGFADRIFRIIHPAVLISGLLLLIVLELLFYFGYVNVTEAGGIFFLLLSGEILVNQYWKKSKENKYEPEELWIPEEEQEEYRVLREEMYPAQKEEIQETRCLIQPEQEKKLKLVCISGNDVTGKRNYPDILVGRAGVLIGKTKGESDVMLDSPTVSRMHARLDMADDRFYVKDLNSKNGTFWNGQRLNPQESREIFAGDTVAFAEIEYLVYLARNQ